CSIQSPQETHNPVDVALVLVDPEADAKDIAANVGDAVLCLQLRIPALSIRASEGEEAGVWPRTQRVEQFGIAKRHAADALEQVLLERSTMCGDAFGGEAVLLQHPSYRGEAVERRRVEGRPKKSARVLGIAD